MTSPVPQFPLFDLSDDECLVVDCVVEVGLPRRGFHSVFGTSAGGLADALPTHRGFRAGSRFMVEESL